MCAHVRVYLCFVCNDRFRLWGAKRVCSRSWGEKEKEEKEKKVFVHGLWSSPKAADGVPWMDGIPKNPPRLW